ncbi:BMA_0021/BMA_0022 family TOMM bacteriocin [Pseudoalteromonas sp. PPB1]|uniref:BMA_0021/BMA_0022 family TOMM bacteriocin n=1 Tax=Pseudoalteromonas sp. PPB1 TaxID=2756136 RepID=UPI001890E36D|nr:BMA_0021/BMA_0022 family TOMM bacteriocin [Pseudoalteromonas sp. PPB1]
MELTKQLLEFRSVYMKSLAKAWNDKDFRTKLCSENNALSIFKEYFDYDCPWNITFTISDKGEGPFYNSLRGVYMTSALSFDRFLVYVPKKPSIPTPVDAIADYYSQNTWLLENKQHEHEEDLSQLTSFLQNFDDLIHQALPSNSNNDDISEGAGSHPVKDLRIPEASYDLGNSNTDFTNFGGVMFSALALSWSNKVFRNSFINTNQSETREIGASAVLLKEWLDYDYPWDVDLVVREDENAKYARTFPATVKLTSGESIECNVAFALNTENYEEKLNNLTSNLSDFLFANESSIEKANIESISVSESTIAIDKWVWCVESEGNYQQVQKTPLGIILSFPEAPDDKASQPVALTRYNNDGPGFPFTC